MITFCSKPISIPLAEYSRLTNSKVYPGQPLVIALFILKVYPNASAAFLPTPHGWADAVGNSSVPGSGDMVRYAVDILQHYKATKDPVATIAFAHNLWKRGVGPGTNNHEAAYIPGLKLAQAHEAEFTKLVSEWNWE